MSEKDDQRRLAESVFAVTGEKLPEDDPLVVAALFYADTLRVAAKDAAATVASAGEIERAHLAHNAVKLGEATTATLLLIDEAKRLVKSASAAQQLLADSFETRMHKAMREYTKQQARQGGQGSVPTVHAGLAVIAALLLGAALFAFGTAAVCGYSFSWMNDASVGRAFLRTLPTMDPAQREKLVDHLQHSRK